MKDSSLLTLDLLLIINRTVIANSADVTPAVITQKKEQLRSKERLIKISAEVEIIDAVS